MEGNIPFKDGTKETTIELFDKLLQNEKIHTIYNIEIEAVVRDEENELFKIETGTKSFHAKSIIVAIGKMGKPNKPSYKIPLSIKKLVNFNLDSCTKGENILVVGGGNSAAEYAYDLADDGNTTTLIYRKPTFTRLNPENQKILDEYSASKKLNIIMAKDVVSLDDENGKVKANLDDDTSQIYDRVVYAIGGTTPVDFLKKCGIVLDDNNQPIYDEHNRTAVACMYVAGDISSKSGGSIAIALNQAYNIINSYLRRNGKMYSYTDKVKEFFEKHPEDVK